MSGLDKQLVSFPFTGGLDTKSDSKFVKPTKLLDLQNGIFSSPGRIRKRNGYTPMSANRSEGGTLSQAQAVMTLGNELVAASGYSLHSYDNAQAKWVNRGWKVATSDTPAFNSVNVTQAPVVQNTNQQFSNDSATYNGVTRIYVWEDSSTGSAMYRIVDLATGNVIVGSTAITPVVGGDVCVKPKVLLLGTNFLITWVDTDNAANYAIASAYIDATNPFAAISSSISYGTGLTYGLKGGTGKQNYDVCLNSAGTRAYFVYFANDAGNNKTCAFYVLTATPQNVTAQVVVDTTKCWAPTVFWDLFAGGPVFVWCDQNAAATTGNVKFNAYNAALGASLNAQTLYTSGEGIATITGCSTSSSALALTIFIGRVGGGVLATVQAPYTFDTLIGTMAGAYVWSARSTATGGVVPVTKAFLYSGITAGSTAFCVVAYDMPVTDPGVVGASNLPGAILQPTYFMIDGTGRAIAKILYANGGGVPHRAQNIQETDNSTASANGSAMLAEVYTSATPGTFAFTVLQKDALSTVSGHIYTLTGVTDVTLVFWDAQNSYGRQEAQGGLHIGGGYLSLYDGATLTELGFHLYPEMVYPTKVAAAGHTYSYVACFEWTDNRGHIHRSAPSPPLTWTQANAIDGTHTATFAVGNASPITGGGGITQKTGVQTVLYRTVDAGTVYYRASLTTTDSTTDANLIGNPPLYTNGGVVDDIPPNACSMLATFALRVWAIDTTQSDVLWYSKQLVPGTPVEFSDLFTLNIDPRGGDITAIASMDDKLIVFKKTSIFYVTGQGPDDTGGQNDFGSGTLITSDVGCVAPRSVVLTPDGLMFQSAKGIYLLDRGLGVSYIGAEVEARITAGTTKITGAYLQPNSQRAVFVSPNLASGYALVYDYLMRQWSVSVSAWTTQLLPNDAAVWSDPTQGNTPMLALPTAQVPGGSTVPVIKENYSGYSDQIGTNSADQYVSLLLTTAYIQLAQTQGFQRVYKALLIGECQGAHVLTFAIDYDFAGSYTQSLTETINGIPVPEQYRFFPSTQKCEAISFRISDSKNPNVSVYGEGVTISGLALEVGVKRGAYKLPAAQSTG